MGFQLRHPVGLTTNTFSTGADPEVGNSGQDRRDAAISQEMPDFQLYRYRFAASVWQYRRGLTGLTVTEMNALEAFFDAVDGDPFEFSDGSCGPATGWVAVKLSPESYQRVYDYAGAGQLSVALVMIQNV